MATPSGPLTTGTSATPPRLRPPWTLQRMRFAVLGLVAFGLLVVSMHQTGVSPARLFASIDDLIGLFQRMWPPVYFEWRRYLDALVVTFFMVVAATGLAIVLSIPFAVLSARNTTTGRIAYSVSRGIIVFTRAVPDIVWALVFVRAIGIGPLAGVLAMGLNSIGMLGKLYADAIEEAPQGPIEAMRAGGASRIQVLVTGILPQVIPTWVSLSLYRVDINVRTSVILGFVGAGGIGFELQRVLGQLVYPRALTIVFMMFLLIASVEQISAFARKAIISGEVTDENPFKLRARVRAYRDERKPGSASATDEGGVEDGQGPAVAGPATTVMDPPAPGDTTSRTIASAPAAGTLGALSIDPGDGPLRPPRSTLRRKKSSSAIIAVVLFFVSCWVVGLTPQGLASSLVAVGQVGAGMFPPDFVTNWEGVLEMLLETFWIAVAATVMGMILSLPFAILAARNVAPSRFAYRASRFAMLVERGIPELILAVLFVVAVGLGPFAGVLALTVGAIGFSGKLMADAIENLPSPGIEGLTSVGASWTQRVFTGVLPQAMPLIVGIGIYTLDVYIRAATILGIVGAGGIGGILNSTVQTHAYDRTLAIVLLIFVAVYGFERLSGWLRQQLL